MKDMSSAKKEINALDEVDNNFQSSCGKKFSKEDLVHVWDNVAKFVEDNLLQEKGINIKGLGIFTISEWKLGIGNHKFVHEKKPVFVMSEKLVKCYHLRTTHNYTSDKITAQMLNVAAIAEVSHQSRHMVSDCICEVIQAFTRLLGQNRDVKFPFSKIGTLHVRNKQVQMKFSEEFLCGTKLHRLCNLEGHVCGSRPKDATL